MLAATETRSLLVLVKATRILITIQEDDTRTRATQLIGLKDEYQEQDELNKKDDAIVRRTDISW